MAMDNTNPDTVAPHIGRLEEGEDLPADTVPKTEDYSDFANGVMLKCYELEASLYAIRLVQHKWMQGQMMIGDSITAEMVEESSRIGCYVRGARARIDEIINDLDRSSFDYERTTDHNQTIGGGLIMANYNLTRDQNTLAGHEAARAWYADLDKRIKDAAGYFVPSKLREAFYSVPTSQQGAFLDAVGTLFPTWKVAGEPNPTGFEFTESIALDAMTPEQQDALADGSIIITAAEA